MTSPTPMANRKYARSLRSAAVVLSLLSSAVTASAYNVVRHDWAFWPTMGLIGFMAALLTGSAAYYMLVDEALELR